MSKELLKEFIQAALAERAATDSGSADLQQRADNLSRNEPQAPVDIWDSSYQYSSADGPNALVKSARAHFRQMMGQGMKGPSDPKFMNAVAKRLQLIGVPQNDIAVVLGKLRMSK